MSGEQKQRKLLGLDIETKINVGDILTMLGMFCAVVVISFGVWRDLYDRVNLNDKKLVVLESRISEVRREQQQDRQDIRDALDEIKLLIRRLEAAKLGG